MFTPMPGTQLELRAASIGVGPYELIGRIGYGGMGAVYLARYQGEAGVVRLYAVKVMHEHLIGDERAVEMLRDEARLTALVHHPNVIDLVGLEFHRGRYYVVMEYVEGCTLHQLLKAHPEKRPPERVVPIVAGLLDGLQAAHSACDHEGRNLGLVHRDVSSENILVGIDGYARIADFGIAKATTRTTITRPGVRKGKYAYMAPEQVLGDPVDARTDLFAAGIVLYNALTGTRLFYGTSDPDTLHNIMNQPVAPPSQVGLHPHSRFDEVCLQALQRDPDRRFQSAGEMAAALRAAAVDAGYHGSSADVGSWVEEAFGIRLRERRKAVASLLGSRRASTVADAHADEDLSGPTDVMTAPTVRLAPEDVPVTPWVNTPRSSPPTSQSSPPTSQSSPPTSQSSPPTSQSSPPAPRLEELPVKSSRGPVIAIAGASFVLAAAVTITALLSC
jgi:eukaryotic-like serine/threonine-protein kinase